MSRLLAITMFVLVALSSGPLRAADGAAVLLKAGGGVDPELVADLTEVLVSALLQKSKTPLNFVGKEALAAELDTRRSDGGQACKDSLDCLRAYGKERGVVLFVVGTIARTANGHRLELTRLSLGDSKDKTEKRMVDGDVTGLIVEVEASADWILVPDPSFLVLRVVPTDAQIKLDGAPIRIVQDQPIEIASGAHNLELTAPDYLVLKKDLNCAQGRTCRLELFMEKAPLAVAVATEVKATPKAPSKPTKLYKIMAWSTAGLSVAAIGVGIWSALQLKSAEDSYTKRAQELCGTSPVCKVSKATFDADSKLNGYESDGSSAAGMATVSFVTVGVAAGASIIFFILDGMQAKPAATAWDLLPIVGPDFGGLGFHAQF